MALPKTTIDRIEADAKKAAMVTEYVEYDGGPSNSARMQLTSRVDPIQKEFYIKGATAQAERAQKLVISVGYNPGLFLFNSRTKRTDGAD